MLSKLHCIDILFGIRIRSMVCNMYFKLTLKICICLKWYLFTLYILASRLCLCLCLTGPWALPVCVHSIVYCTELNCTFLSPAIMLLAGWWLLLCGGWIVDRVLVKVLQVPHVKVSFSSHLNLNHNIALYQQAAGLFQSFKYSKDINHFCDTKPGNSNNRGIFKN